MSASFVLSARTIICVDWPARANFGAERYLPRRRESRASPEDRAGPLVLNMFRSFRFPYRHLAVAVADPAVRVRLGGMKVKSFSWVGVGTDKFDHSMHFFRDLLGLEVWVEGDRQAILKTQSGQQLEIFGSDEREN